MNEKYKKTKIVCTIGPASWDPEIIKKMITAGMNIARVNGAFADIPELKRVGDMIRSLSDNIGLMLDVKGTEVRLNKFPESILIKTGQEIVIGSNESDALFPVTYPDLYKDIASGQIIYIDKGAVSLRVEKIQEGRIYTTVLTGTVIESGKGMNFPGARLKNPALTTRDKEQIKFIVSDNWDLVATSFVRNASDIAKVKEHLGESQIKIIAKIEDQQGVDNFDEILIASDGIMIARGDMGSEIPFEKLPIIQKEIIYKCNRASKPVITATNMLESMTTESFPTRAEITDVANAVLDGSDALMTSGETSSGKYPVETVNTMSRIIIENEQYLMPEILETIFLDDKQVNVAISNAAFEMVAELEEITKIVVLTRSGLTARLLARLDLPIRIIALVPDDTLKRQLQLTKGLETVVFNKEFTDRDKTVSEVVKSMFALKEITANDKILLIGNCNYRTKKEVNYPNVFEYLEVANYLDNK